MTLAHADAIRPTFGVFRPEEVWNGPIEQLLSRLSTTPAGLTAAEAEARLIVYGTNDQTAVKRPSRWPQFEALA